MLQQSFNPEPMAFLIESAPALPQAALGGYRIYRSPVQTTLVNIVAVNKQEQMIAVVSSDLTISEAQELVQMLNQEFEETKEN
jgi:hypothetical protein